MSLISWMNERLKKFTIVDVKLSQWAAIFLTLVIVKLVPQILDISIGWFAALAILCAIRPLYVVFLKR